MIQLPDAEHQGLILERALAKRRTIREFSPTAIDLNMLSQLLWAAQGITSARGFRTAPSAGALYPLEVDVVAGHVDGVESGIYRYLPQGHRLRRQHTGDFRREVAQAAWEQHWIAQAPVVFVLRAIPKRTAIKYGKRANLYVPLEAGAIMQNLLLQAVSLGLEAATVGAFQPQKLEKQLGGNERAEPLVIIAVGHRSP